MPLVTHAPRLCHIAIQQPTRFHMSDHCAFCREDAGKSKLYVSLGNQLEPRFRICSGCYLVAIRHGYHVVYKTAA
jgi:hypothetical protein